MISRRQLSCLIASGVVSAKAPAFAQAARVYHIGFLGVGKPSAYAHRLAALRDGLRDLGYVEGKNVVLEIRWAEGAYDRIPELAAQLVASKPDVIVTHTADAVRAVQRTSTTLPIVMTDAGDAIRAGLAQSLARPGGNVTGSTILSLELNMKRLQFLKEMLPRMMRVALLLNPDYGAWAPILRSEMQSAGKTAKIDVQIVEARQPSDFAPVFQEMSRSAVDAVLITENPLFTVNTLALANLALAYRLPLAGFSEFADNGGLLGYGVNFPEMYRRAAFFVDKILRGAKPGDIPIEQPTKFDLFININTAKTLGLSVPASLLARADKTIG